MPRATLRVLTKANHIARHMPRCLGLLVFRKQCLTEKIQYDMTFFVELLYLSKGHVTTFGKVGGLVPICHDIIIEGLRMLIVYRLYYETADAFSFSGVMDALFMNVCLNASLWMAPNRPNSFFISLVFTPRTVLAHDSTNSLMESSVIEKHLSCTSVFIFCSNSAYMRISTDRANKLSILVPWAQAADKCSSHRSNA